MLVQLLLFAIIAQGPKPAVAGPLVVYHAGSLAAPMKALFREFGAMYPSVKPLAEASGSIDVARKLTELGKIPDVVATADYSVIEQLLMPKFATWNVSFVSNAIVVAYTAKSRGGEGITAANWFEKLRAPGARVGRSDPSLDPGGYRALLMFQLAERHYRRPGLAAQLEAASPPRYMRPKEVELVALLEVGEVDYAVFYRSVALQAGFRFVTLPKEIDLSDPGSAAIYSTARVAVPKSRTGTDSLTFRGEPILYAMTIPLKASNPAAARAFVQFVVGPSGRRIFTQRGFVSIPKPLIRGDTLAASGIVPP